VLYELTLLADEHDAEPLADALLAAGALSVAVEDADADTAVESALYGEPGLHPQRQAWQRSRLRILFEGPEPDGRPLIQQAAAAAGLKQPGRIESCALVSETDWVRATQSQFPPTRISDRLWIVPSWHEAPSGNVVAVRLDPGVAFGTGTHPTTQLCLAWLDAHLQSGDNVLDYGCGSGILAIAAGLLGAKQIVGVDVDPQALTAARDNSAINSVDARYTEPAGLAAGQFDIVLANILSNPLKLLAPALLARVGKGGALVLSGVLERQAEEVITAYRQADAGVSMRVWQVADGWACLAGRRDA
jgi:ribosomal protein L11 methyltransferase